MTLLLSWTLYNAVCWIFKGMKMRASGLDIALPGTWPSIAWFDKDDVAEALPR